MSGNVSGYQAIPEYLANDIEHRRQIARKVNSLNLGKYNATTDITIAPNTSTTTLTDPRLAFSSWIGFMGLTEEGAAAIIKGIYVTDMNSGSCTLNHQSSPEANQDIRVLIIG